MCSLTHFHHEKARPTAAGPAWRRRRVLVALDEAPSPFSLKEAHWECGESSATVQWLDEDEDAPVLEISGMA